MIDVRKGAWAALALAWMVALIGCGPKESGGKAGAGGGSADVAADAGLDAATADGSDAASVDVDDVAPPDVAADAEDAGQGTDVADADTDGVADDVDATPAVGAPSITAVASAAAVAVGAPVTLTIDVNDPDGDLTSLQLERSDLAGTSAGSLSLAAVGIGATGGKATLTLGTEAHPAGPLTLIVRALDAQGHDVAAPAVVVQLQALGSGGTPPTVTGLAFAAATVRRPSQPGALRRPALGFDYADAEADIRHALLEITAPDGVVETKLLPAHAVGVVAAKAGVQQGVGLAHPMQLDASSPLGVWKVVLTLLDDAGHASTVATASFTCSADAGAAGPSIASFAPTSASPGDKVTVSGAGLDTAAFATQAWVGAAPAEVVSVTATTLELTVPAGARGGPITLRTPAGAASSQQALSVAPGVAITASVEQVVAGGTVRFSAQTSGPLGDGVVWAVDGSVGGTAAVGTITAAGVYTAPATPPAGGAVTVSATSQSDASVFASRKLAIVALQTPGAAPIGAAGGVVDDGLGAAWIQAPAGALAQAVTLTAAPATLLPAPAAGRDVLGALVCGPDGTTFAKPVTLRIPLRRDLPPQTKLGLRQFFPASGTMGPIVGEATVAADGVHAVASVDHFSTWVVDAAALGGAPALAVTIAAAEPTSAQEGSTRVVVLSGQGLAQDLRVVPLRDGQPTTELRIGTVLTRGGTMAFRLDVAVLPDLAAGAARAYTLSLRDAAGIQRASVGFTVQGLAEWVVPAGSTQTIGDPELGTFSAIELDGVVDARAQGVRALATHHVRLGGTLLAHGANGGDGTGTQPGAAASGAAGAGGQGRGYWTSAQAATGAPGSPCRGDVAGCVASGAKASPEAIGGQAGENIDALGALLELIGDVIGCAGGSVISCAKVVLDVVALVDEVETGLDGGAAGHGGYGSMLAGGGGGGGGAGYVSGVLVLTAGGAGGGGGAPGRPVWLETPGDMRIDGQLRNHGGDGGQGADALDLDGFGGGGGGGGAAGALRLHAGRALQLGPAAQLRAGPGQGGRGGLLEHQADDGSLQRRLFRISRGGDGAGAIRSVGDGVGGHGGFADPGMIDPRTLDHGVRTTQVVDVALHGLMAGLSGDRAFQVQGPAPGQVTVVPCQPTSLGCQAKLTLFSGRNVIRAGRSLLGGFSAGSDPMYDKVVVVLAADADGDQISDEEEAKLGLDPNDSDSDDDGLHDGVELMLGTDPAQADSDGDGVPDGAEVGQGLDPKLVDSDKDGASDGLELILGSNPKLASSVPPPPSPGAVYAVVSGRLALLDPATGALGTIGTPLGGLGFGIGFAPGQALLGVSGGSLHAIDAGSAAATKVGDLGAPGGKPALSATLAVHPTSGVVVAAELGPAPTFAPTGQLLALNPATGAATRVGPGTGPAIHALTFAATGELYAAVAGAAGQPDQLIALDPATGAQLASLGSLGVVDVFGLCALPSGALLAAAGSGQAATLRTVTLQPFAVVAGANASGPVRGLATLPPAGGSSSSCANPPAAADCDGNGVADSCDVQAPFEQLAQSNDGGTQLRVADHDGDGDLDLYSTATAGLTVYRNDGKGAFAAGELVAGGAFKGPDVFVADLDGDKDADVVVLAAAGTTATIHLQGPNGAFTQHAVLTTPNGPTLAVFGDWSGDGLVDIVLLCKGTSSIFGSSPALLPILAGKSGATWTFTAQNAVTPGLPSSLPARMLLADLDGANGPDLAVSGKVFFNTGSGLDFDNPVSADGEVAGQLAGDASLDLLASDKCWVGDGKGGFAAGPAHGGGGWIEGIDWDGDGDLDVVAAPQYAGSVAPLLRINDGKASFVTVSGGVVLPGEFGAFRSVAADFDGDGRTDVAFSSVGAAAGGPFSGHTVLRSRGYGGAPDCNANGKPDSCDISAGTSKDQNGDGKPDECAP